MNHFLNIRKPPGTESASQPGFEDHRCPGDLATVQGPATGSSARPAGLTGRILKHLLDRCGNPPIRIVLPGGAEIAPDQRQPAGTIRFADRRTVLAVALDPMFQFAEAYADGRLEFHGNLADCLSIIYRHMNESAPKGMPGRFLNWLRPASSNSLQRSRQNIHHHYDIGNDFYRLWLDDQMVYTCAYFANRDFSLEQAQVAKLEHVCRKLRLRPGMQVVEAGCGWGALAIHMAKHYGVRVTAFNISREQVTWARERTRRSGLTGQVDFVQDDWRNIRGQYDAFASVGMLEHVGLARYHELGKVIRQCLRPSGLGLIHTIGQNQPQPLSPWIERRIFPGAYPPSVRQLMEVFEPNRLSVLDLENLRLHYAETLRHWLNRFEDSADQVRRQFGERFVRMWRFYLSGSAAAFESGSLQLFQVLFAAAESNRIPRTRACIYANAHAPPDDPQGRLPRDNSRSARGAGAPS